jgi:hypothetical protein
MKLFRNVLMQKMLALATGLLVLNMSLFLAEVEALKLLKDRAMTENIAKLIMGAANEEEKDFAASGEEDLSSFKSTLALQNHYIFISADIVSVIKYHDITKADKTISPFLETLSPPPKSII